MKAIMYHYVRPRSSEYPHLKHLTLSDFERQLDFFDKEYGFCNKKEFHDMIYNGVENDKVMLTFDDGLLDHHKYVFPILKRRKLWGIFYLCSDSLEYFYSGQSLEVHKIHYILARHNSSDILDYLKKIVSEHMLIDVKNIDFRTKTYAHQTNDQFMLEVKRILNFYISYEFRDDIVAKLFDKFIDVHINVHPEIYMNHNQIKELSQAGMILGSHGKNHLLMSKLSYKEQEQEISESLDYFSNFLVSGKIETYCYPYGHDYSFNTDTIHLLKKYGIKYAFSVNHKDISKKDFNILKLNRYDCNQFKYGGCND